MKEKEKKTPRPLVEKSGKASLQDKPKKANMPILAKERGEVKVAKLSNDNPLLTSIFGFYIEEWKREHTGDKNPREWFYVSDVGRCPRSVYYQFYNPEKKKDMAASTIIMFKFGNLFHEEMQRVLTKLGHTANKYIEFGTWSKVGFMKRGRIDVLLYMIEVEGEVNIPVLVIGEIKSQNPYGFENDPYDSEIDQTLSYIHDCKNDPYFKGKNIADYGLLIYMDRAGLANPPICMWQVDYSEARVQVIKGEFKRLYRAIKAKKIPDRPYEMDSVPCNYCRFQKSICWVGFAVPEEPTHEADPTIPEPTKEIVESMSESCIRLTEEIKEKEADLDIAKKVMFNYFKSTGASEILPKLGGKIKFSKSKTTTIKEAYLWRKMKHKWNLFSKLNLGMMKKAVKEGKLDAATFQRALIYGTSDGNVSITRPKKPKDEKKKKKKEEKK